MNAETNRRQQSSKRRKEPLPKCTLHECVYTLDVLRWLLFPGETNLHNTRK